MQQEHAFLEQQDKDVNGGCLSVIICVLFFLIVFGLIGFFVAALVYGLQHV